MHSSRARGFTLVELMIVVTLIGTLAVLAMTSFERNRRLNVVDNWASVNRDAIATASRRAVVNHVPYMVVFTATPGPAGTSTVQWCTVQGTAPAFADAATTCPLTPPATQPGFEIGKIQSTGPDDATSAYYATSPDIVGAYGAYAAAAKFSLSNTVVYFGRTGVVSTIVQNVLSPALTAPATNGFTLYTRRKLVDDFILRRRLVVYGLTGKTRIIEGY